MNNAQIKGMRELADAMAANRTKIVKTSEGFEVRHIKVTGATYEVIGITRTFPGAVELARSVKS